MNKNKLFSVKTGEGLFAAEDVYSIGDCEGVCFQGIEILKFPERW